ncbi:hypothetical protein K474DRAFT_1680774 [Panus rudis PR-1116 ss-1]|nr:hypothetical protein K474DRAFT_1680774 [Panus rudis PR-1116 ss-1]
MTFVGYANGTKGYIFWNPAKRSLVVSRDVTFDENVFPARKEPGNHPVTPGDNPSQVLMMIMIRHLTLPQILIMLQQMGISRSLCRTSLMNLLLHLRSDHLVHLHQNQHHSKQFHHHPSNNHHNLNLLVDVGRQWENQLDVVHWQKDNLETKDGNHPSEVDART